MTFCTILGGYGAAVDENLGGASQGSYSGYESSSTTGYAAGANNAVLGGGEYYSSSSYGGVGGGVQASNSGYEQQGLSGASLAGGAGYNFSSSEQQSSSATTYATDAQGLFKDPNPQIIRRPTAGGVQTFTQRVVVRFLQPPPVAPPGVSVSKSNDLPSEVLKKTVFQSF